jgi:hypothetical protein
MTSATGKKTATDRRGSRGMGVWPMRHAFALPVIGRPGLPSRGTTLVELLLAIALVAAMGGVTVLSLAALTDRSPVPEAAESLATAMRMVRADAATLGRQLRLDVDPETHDVRVLIEPDPFGEPGTFVPWTGCTWTRHLDNERVRVLSCELIGPDAPLPIGLDDDDLAYRPITFYPDGSSDSAEVVLAARRDDDLTRARITLNGLGGAGHIEIFQADDEADRTGLDERN